MSAGNGGVTHDERYSTTDVEVVGGSLRVGIWDGPPGAPTILAVHGITASHMTWPLLAQALPEVRIVAPDLRGRGRSNAIQGPFGMPAHAHDMAQVLRATGTDRASVVGHSMGGFVSLVLADRYPDLVRSLVLVDGGLPLLPPPGVEHEDMIQGILGPAAARLEMTFPDHAAYRQFWRQHPAFADDWNELVADYVDYDLCGEPPQLRPCTSYAAVEADARELAGGESLLAAIERLRHPAQLLRAPRGLLDEVPPLYPDPVVEQWREAVPHLEVSLVEDVNHYTVVMHERGVKHVAAAARQTLTGA